MPRLPRKYGQFCSIDSWLRMAVAFSGLEFFFKFSCRKDECFSDVSLRQGEAPCCAVGRQIIYGYASQNRTAYKSLEALQEIK